MAEERLTITKAAARFGVSVDAVRRRLRKGDLPGQRDNKGQWWVVVDPDAEPPIAPPPPSPDDRLAGAMLAPPQQHGSASLALQEQVADVRGRLLLAETRADRAEAREAEASAEVGQVRRERDQARQEREDARVRAARAEGTASALREALAEAQRPFWRRWLG